MEILIFCVLKDIHEKDGPVFLKKILSISALKRFDYGLSEINTKDQAYYDIDGWSTIYMQ